MKRVHQEREERASQPWRAEVGMRECDEGVGWTKPVWLEPGSRVQGAPCKGERAREFGIHPSCMESCIIMILPEE